MSDMWFVNEEKKRKTAPEPEIELEPEPRVGMKDGVVSIVFAICFAGVCLIQFIYVLVMILNQPNLDPSQYAGAVVLFGFLSVLVGFALWRYIKSYMA